MGGQFLLIGMHLLIGGDIPVYVSEEEMRVFLIAIGVLCALLALYIRSVNRTEAPHFLLPALLLASSLLALFYFGISMYQDMIYPRQVRLTLASLSGLLLACGTLLLTVVKLVRTIQSCNS
ncbi:hypothetical protein DCC85_01945 [Paenibacillus sp. CAA11]|nr:hypothetical protein DCC85_01945 [Paenibacillus sp. CAA11]